MKKGDTFKHKPSKDSEKEIEVKVTSVEPDQRLTKKTKKQRVKSEKTIIKGISTDNKRKIPKLIIIEQ